MKLNEFERKKFLKKLEKNFKELDQEQLGAVLDLLQFFANVEVDILLNDDN